MASPSTCLELFPCASCRKHNSTLRCTGCRCVYYCSKGCQRQHWSVHKKVCKTISIPSNELSSLVAKYINSSTPLTNFLSTIVVDRFNFHQRSYLFACFDRDKDVVRIKVMSKEVVSAALATRVTTVPQILVYPTPMFQDEIAGPAAVWDIHVNIKDRVLVQGYNHHSNYILTLVSTTPNTWEVREEDSSKVFTTIS